jgi:pimeloyl-ACP methyl ester carboxylesterase
MKLYSAKGNKERPLLVGLHSWSGDYKQTGWQIEAVQWCLENNWHFIHPNFRGPNTNSDACASDKAVQDIIDSIHYMQKNYQIDNKRIYLMGSSGGGHMALIMAGRHPEIWAGVSAWVPISDINKWWNECNNTRYDKYARHIEKVLSKEPAYNQLAITQAKRRSPITYLDKAREVNIDISAGINDGRKGGSVPFSHSLNAFNAIVENDHEIPEELIEEFYSKKSLPQALPTPKVDPLYKDKKLIFRKITEHTRVNIFQGGHEIIPHAALNWLKEQRKTHKAQWSIKKIITLKNHNKAQQSGL